ncbi:MAG: glycosyl hydrolase family 18 protein [Niastella sp.]|uniref:glycosyl hydrolase family 18 protein n=1 Tax=Niastella sp. TaxID=1869183 RepID=UPI00389A3491
MKKNLPGRIFLALLLFASVQRASAQFKVVGYMPSWAGDVNTVQYSKLTHINYAFILPNSNGTLQGLDNPGKLSSLVTKAHANGVKVQISVGGWNDGNDSGFEGLAANSGSRSTFINALISLVNQYNLDGVDIDWEYPDNGASANNYLTLMTALSTEMHNRGKILTAAVVGDGGASILNGVFNVVDFLNLMAYDENDYQHSTYAYAQKSMNYWLGRGLPKSKCVLGVPFYGHPTWESYAQLVNRGADPYSDTYDGVGYNGITTIKNKTNLAFDNGNGIMMWELSNDLFNQYSLVSAIHDVVLTRGGGTNPPPPTSGILIQAESYSNMSGIQTEATTDVDGGQNVGWIDQADWLAFYNINFPVTGQYKVEYRVASLNGGGVVSCDLNAGSIQLGQIAVPNTGGWQNWTTISQTVTVNAGTYNFGVYAQAGGWNLNWIRITPVTTTKVARTEAFTGLVDASIQNGKAFNIYPNPVQQQLNIQSGTSLEGGIIRIYDISGKIVMSARVASNKIDVSSLTKGVYTLMFTKGEQKITRQFIK